MPVILNRDILQLIGIPWTLFFNLSALFDREQRENLQFFLRNIKFIFEPSLAFQRDLCRSIPELFDALVNTNSRIINLNNPYRMGHTATNATQRGEPAKARLHGTIRLNSFYWNSTAFGNCIQRYSPGAKFDKKLFKIDQNIISLVDEILQLKLTGIFSELAWGDIRFAFQAIELDPEPESDEETGSTGRGRRTGS